MARDLQIHTRGTFTKKLHPTTGDFALVCKQETEASSTPIPRAFLVALPVFEGGPLYQLEARIRMLQADLATAETELKRLQSLPRQEDLQRAELDRDYADKALEAAQADYERLNALAGKGVAMTSELKEKEMDVIAAKADRETAEIQLKLVRDGATSTAILPSSPSGRPSTSRFHVFPPSVLLWSPLPGPPDSKK